MVDSIHSPYIFTADGSKFDALVLSNSNSGPVLVNFWSKNAGPCLRQYPILDKLIHGYNGKLLLVNIDTLQEFQITKTYGITSIPTLKLFRDKKVVATLHGFQSEADLKNILNQHVSLPSDQTLAQAIKLYANGNHTTAYDTISQAIMTDPDNPRLPLALAKLFKYEHRFQEAVAVLTALPEKIASDINIIQFKHLLDFHLITDESQNIEALIEQVNQHPNHLNSRVQLSAYYITQKHYEPALSLFAEIMVIDQNFQDNYVQKALLKLLIMLGNEHALTKPIRDNLQKYTH